MEMLKKLRKSSRVTLVLAGIAALCACSSEDDQRRDVYKSREDCLADWANKPEDCKRATEPRHASSGFWYGPTYPYRKENGRWPCPHKTRHCGLSMPDRSACPSTGYDCTC